ATLTPTPTATVTPTPTPTKVPSAVALSGTSTIKVGATTQLKATLTPATDTVTSWSSGTATVATVSNTGFVTGIRVGTSVITVKSSGGATANITITVTAADTASIALSGTSTVKVGKTTTLTAKVTPTTDTVAWTSASTDIATVSSAGVVTGVKAGKSVITAKSSSGKTATLEVTVEAAYADTAQLYDSSKNKLYVLEGTTYRLATYADYKSGKFSKYYKKGAVDEYLYTGWQTIDGLTYYFKKDNTKVTGEQVIGGVKYTFDSDGALSQGNGTLGIDVSKYQPSINWASVKASGISYVIIRCGYRGSSTGVLVEDPYFRSHIKGAKAAGLKVGVYFFTTAVTEAEAVEEASMCAALCSGYGLNYPVFMDCESSGRAGYMSMSAAQRTSVIKAFCSTIRSAGYTPGVYANKTWLSSYMNASELSGYKIWLAQYNSQVTYKGRYDLWQFTSKGSVNGISGNVDMNQSYLGY
ncbi:MAG: GH25 family lysozyme, partial [bacterium]|nr:GH25 family lysozyme [bacterium]